MRDFKHRDHAEDTMQVQELDDCNECMSGAVAFAVNDSSWVHLEPPMQRLLAEWLNQHLIESSHDALFGGPQLLERIAEATSDPLPPALRLVNGETELNVDAGMGLDGDQLIALVRGVLGAPLPYTTAEQVAGVTMTERTLMTLVASALGLERGTPYGEIIAAARSMRAFSDKWDHLHDQESLLSELRDLFEAADAPPAELIGRVKSLQQAIAAEFRAHEAKNAELRDLRGQLRTAREMIAQVNTALGTMATSGIASVVDRVRDMATQYVGVRAVLNHYDMPCVPSETAVTVARVLEHREVTTKTLEAVRAGRDRLKAELRRLRAEFTNIEGMPVDTDLSAEDAASLVARIDKALESAVQA